MDLLKGKPVFLRGMQSGEKLSFDSHGVEIGTATPQSFAFSAVKVEKVHKSSKELEIISKRVLLVFQTSDESPSLKDLRFVPLPEKVEITIAVDKSHPEDLETAIRKVFAASPEEALAGKSTELESAALDSIASTASHHDPAPQVQTIQFAGAPVFIPKGNISAPRLIHSVSPAFTPEAKNKEITGVCVLSMIVDKSGRPERIRIVRSLNPGLDVNAIAAVSQYRFEPATYRGEPVNVLVNIEVNFRIY